MSKATTYKELFQEYKEDGYVCLRWLTSVQRKKYDMKAHTFQERINFPFKYLPMHGGHLYMFVFHEQAELFDEMTNNEGRMSAAQINSI